MSERQWCSGRTYLGRMGFATCSNTPTSTHGGKPYCHVHDPVKAAARRDRAKAKLRAEIDAKDRRRELASALAALAAAERAVIEAADRFVGSGDVALGVSKDAEAALISAVLARRKAKALAEQAKEASRG